MTPILNLRIRTRRDLLLARQRTRRLASLLGFDVLEQATLAAAVFELARQTRRQEGETALRFSIIDDTLRIEPAGDEDAESCNMLRIVKVLPNRTLDLAVEDMLWLTKELEKLVPDRLFAEIVRQNQELLRALRELQISQSKVAQLSHEASRPAAA